MKLLRPWSKGHAVGLTSRRSMLVGGPVIPLPHTPSRPDLEEQNRPAPTTEDRAAGKRPLVEDPSPAETLPVESSQVPKRRRLVRITDDDDDEELAAPSLVWKPRSRPDVAPATTGQMTRDPPTSHIEPARVVETMAQASTGRTRRRFFTATHRLRPVSFQSYSRTAIYFAICCCL